MRKRCPSRQCHHYCSTSTWAKYHRHRNAYLWYHTQKLCTIISTGQDIQLEKSSASLLTFLTKEIVTQLDIKVIISHILPLVSNPKIVGVTYFQLNASFQCTFSKSKKYTEKQKQHIEMYSREHLEENEENIMHGVQSNKKAHHAAPIWPTTILHELVKVTILPKCIIKSCKHATNCIIPVKI